MKQINSILSATNAQEAVARAQCSSLAAKSARIVRDQRNFIQQLLEDWSRIFTNSPIGILTTLFIFAVLMEIFFSFPMYTDLMSQMTGEGNFMLALVGALFIVLWGAYVSHLISKKMSPAIFDYTVYNEMKFSKAAMPQAAAEEKAHIAARRDLIKGLILGILLLFVVTAVSWQRVWLMGAITGADYSLTHKLLPVVCVLIEIISGIYVGYLIRRSRQLYNVRKFHNEFVREKTLCSYEASMAQAHSQHAIDKGEKLPSTKELGDAMYRYENRALDNDNYVDPVPEKKTLKVVVADNAGFVKGVHLSGILANGEYSNSIVTNDQGEGVLTWDSDTNQVMTIYTDHKQHKGPFRENSTIRIDIDRNN